jgi:biopolymer transport protein ExbD
MSVARAAFELPGKRRRAVLSLAPLIDVTFILLIFFLLVTQFQKYAPVDVALEARRTPVVDTPGAGAGVTETLALTIGADGVLQISGGPAIGIEALTPALIRSVADVMSRGGDSPVIAIAPEPDVALQLLLEVMEAVQKLRSVETQIVVPEVTEGGQP